MAYILRMEMSTMGGNEEMYTLTADGKQTKQGKPLPDLDMGKFWQDMGSTIDSIVSNKVEGWDQVRIHYDKSCRPIYDIGVVAKDGKKREFGIYGTPYDGAELEKGGGPFPKMYLDLYNFMAGRS
eukprot:Phypoly_transcript_16233.p1 GENE.Phypoly_transcript_16233~~Phypoly_transcript_16233.p1  ORF type:complete len:125 (+),score=21.52 Phypoly_transcript_16233:396-770(+)